MPHPNRSRHFLLGLGAANYGLPMHSPSKQTKGLIPTGVWQKGILKLIAFSDGTTLGLLLMPDVTEDRRNRSRYQLMPKLCHRRAARRQRGRRGIIHTYICVYIYIYIYIERERYTYYVYVYIYIYIYIYTYRERGR